MIGGEGGLNRRYPQLATGLWSVTVLMRRPRWLPTSATQYDSSGRPCYDETDTSSRARLRSSGLVCARTVRRRHPPEPVTNRRDQ
jgi:hypothetical protein